MRRQQAGDMPAEVYTRPRYTQAEAARIIEVNSNTFGNWARGYTYMTIDGERSSRALITLAEAGAHRLLVPFVGLAEAYVLNAFRQAGVSMQRIRPALLRLKDEIGLPAPLANRRLKTDGVEILYEYGQQAQAHGDTRMAEDLSELVVVRNNQRVFTEVVADYLTTITYDGNWVSTIHLRRFGDLDVIVDPRVNYGKPTLAERGIRIDDTLSRRRAGESVSDVAWDYDLDEADVRALEPA